MTQGAACSSDASRPLEACLGSAGALLGETSFMGIVLGFAAVVLIVIIVGCAMNIGSTAWSPRGRLCGRHAAHKRRMQHTAGRRPGFKARAEVRAKKSRGSDYKIITSCNHSKYPIPISSSTAHICRYSRNIVHKRQISNTTVTKTRQNINSTIIDIADTNDYTYGVCRRGESDLMGEAQELLKNRNRERDRDETQ